MCSKTTAFSLSLLCGTTHVMSECQTDVRENAVSKYHFPYPNFHQYIVIRLVDPSMLWCMH